MFDLSGALIAAERVRIPSERVAAVKEAVASEVRDVDPTAQPHFTNYFNHTFIPDMVLRWPTEHRERFLFLRGTTDPAWLAGDLNLLAKHRPMILTLDPLTTLSAGKQLEETASDTQTWVTDASGLQSVSTDRKERPLVGLLGQALMRGGKGVAGGDQIRRLVGETQAGFESAAELSAIGAGKAVDAVESSLNSEQAGRLTRMLRAVWEGHGGDAARFPAAESLGSLTDDDLTYLLSSLETAPLEFWRRIGRSVTTEQIGRLKLADDLGSLQRFIMANLSRLTAKGVRVIAEPRRLGERHVNLRWSIDQGCLAMRGTDWTAYLAGRRTEELPPAQKTAAPTLPELIVRSKNARCVVLRVELGRSDGAAAIYESAQRGDILEDPQLQRSASEFGSDEVRASSVVVDRNRTINLDFSRATATAPTSSVLDVIPLLKTAIPLLHKLAADESDDMADLLGADLPRKLGSASLEDIWNE